LQSLSNYKTESIYELYKTTAIPSNPDPVNNITPYPWMKDSNSIRVYQYSSSAENFVSTDIDYNYYNLRFANKPLTWSNSKPLTIYIISTELLGTSTIENFINSTTRTL